METDQTIEYYNKNAEKYFRDTVAVDMKDLYDRFLDYIKPGGIIIDIGAGSGRDVRYFVNCGYRVEGIDSSEELCNLAREYSGISVDCIRIQEWNSNKQYDGIWANASLLHLKYEEIERFIKMIPGRLTKEGVAYISFKTGISSGVDDCGRYFTNMTEEQLRELSNEADLDILDCWITNDRMKRNEFAWINMILRKNTIC